ncbi:MAG: 4-hydroxythreonine-4-phosphate dehydrogenase, partial [Cucumibacter sp.]
MAELAPLAITMGEPAGVGPDIVLQIYAKRVELGAAPFAVYGPVGFYQKRGERLGLKFKIKSVLSEYVKE